MPDRRTEDFYDPWDENGPVESGRLPEHVPPRQSLLTTLIQGVRGVLRTLPIRRFSPRR